MSSTRQPYGRPAPIRCRAPGPTCPTRTCARGGARTGGQHAHAAASNGRNGRLRGLHHPPPPVGGASSASLGSESTARTPAAARQAGAHDTWAARA